MKNVTGVDLNEGDVAIVLRADGTYEIHSCVTEAALNNSALKKSIETNMGIALGINRSLGIQETRTSLYELGMSDEAIEELAAAQGTTTSLQ
jgi:hypothetical protein